MVRIPTLSESINQSINRTVFWYFVSLSDKKTSGCVYKKFFYANRQKCQTCLVFLPKFLHWEKINALKLYFSEERYFFLEEKHKFVQIICLWLCVLKKTCKGQGKELIVFGGILAAHRPAPERIWFHEVNGEISAAPCGKRTFKLTHFCSTVEPLIRSSSRDPISIHLRDIARWTTWFEPRCAVPNTLQKANFVTTSGAFNKSRGRKSQYSPPFDQIFRKTKAKGGPFGKFLWEFFIRFFNLNKYHTISFW